MGNIITKQELNYFTNDVKHKQQTIIKPYQGYSYAKTDNLIGYNVSIYL